MMNFPDLLIFFKSISYPIMKSKKNIPSSDNILNVGEDIVDENGLLMRESSNPNINAVNIHGICNLSNHLPNTNIPRKRVLSTR